MLLCRHLPYPRGVLVNNKPQRSRTPEEWCTYNREGLENKNIVLWYAGVSSISMCPWCKEILIRFDLSSEAETFVLNGTVFPAFKQTVWPKIQQYLQVVMELGQSIASGNQFHSKERPEVATPTLRRAYSEIIAAASELMSRYPQYIKEKESS